ncbi:MAG: hypothetical protein KGI60_01755 [Patescibacteria group bacterium]|nr:hypothetical protein [Patescibacteria group bacterium]
MAKQKPSIRIRFFKTYCAAIRNSIGTKLFRNFFLSLDGKEMDATRNGVVSCAFYASNILHMFPAQKLIRGPHTTVSSTVADMEQSGWYKIGKPRTGAVLVWEPKTSAGSTNAHIGFSVGDDEAISNDARSGSPKKHHWTFGEKDGKPVRRVTAIYWHPALDE